MAAYRKWRQHQVKRCQDCTDHRTLRDASEKAHDLLDSPALADNTNVSVQKVSQSMMERNRLKKTHCALL